jgi:hypothetical protein
MKPPSIRRGRPRGIQYRVSRAQGPQTLYHLADMLENGRLDLSHESDDISLRIMPAKRRTQRDRDLARREGRKASDDRPFRCGISKGPEALRLVADSLDLNPNEEVFVRIMMPRSARAADRVGQ